MSLPWARQWKADWKAIAVGCYGLFVYHFLYILALRYAPAVQANLVHYLWPTLIVVLSPLVVPGTRLRPVHFAAVAAGFAGAALAIASRAEGSGLELHLGYALALGAALVWASYSLLLKRVATTSLPITGLCCLISGLFALGLHYGTQPAMHLSSSQALLVIALGLGPMGAAFYLWSFALKEGDPRLIGVLANATPLLSTAALSVYTGQRLSLVLLLSVLLIVTASSLVIRQRGEG